MAYCSKCGVKLVDGAKFCQKCGSPTQGGYTYTNQRQQEYAGKAYKCPECGELVGIENLVYDEDAQTYTCTQCGETFDECDLEPVYMLDYFDDVLDIEYRIGSDREFLSVRLLVAYGGPNIYVDTWSQQVELYWWTDRASFPLSSEVCDQINTDFEELFNC